MKVVWAPTAEVRALEAVGYIAQDRPAGAAAWLEELLERTASLSRFPRRGPKVPEINRPEYRQLLHDSSRIIYRIDATQVVILTLRHYRREWDPSGIPDGG